MHMQRLLVRIIVILGAFVLGLAGWIYGVTWLGVTTSVPPAWVAVDATGQLVLYRQGQRHPLPQANGIDVGALPVLAPDGRRVAFICEDDAGVVVVRVVAIADGTAIDVYRDVGHVPQGVQWSPDGKYLALRVDGGMESVVVATDGRLPAQTVARGAPAFFDWHPDSRHLLIHAGGVGRSGGVVALYALDTQQTTILHTDSGNFAAPQWNARGDGYFYVRDPQRLTEQSPSVRAQVVEQFRDGRMTVIADEGDADIRLYANPTTAGIAYIVATAESQRLVYWDGGARHVLRDDIPLVAFWAPDGRDLAALIPVDAQQLQWVRMRVDSAQSERYAPFVPSALFARAVQAGDVATYMPWSADAQWLLTPAATHVVGMRVHDGPDAIPLGDGVFGMWLTAIEE